MPVVKALRQITQNVEKDAANLDFQAIRFKDNIDEIALHIATMRMELRGKFVANVPLLSLKVLSRDEQFRLVGKLRPWNFAAGQSVICEGELGDKLYIIEGGTCEVWKNFEGVDTPIVQISKGDFFGEIAVIYKMPRTATVKAVTDVTLLSLSREDLFSTLDASKLDHMKVLARAQVFGSIPLFSKLDGQTKVLVAGKLRFDTWKPGSIILRENAHVSGPAQRIYILETGHGTRSRKKTVRCDGKDEKRLTRSMTEVINQASSCQPGDYFGMLEFLYGCPQLQTLTARSDEDMTTLSISYDEMWSVLTEQALDTGLIFSNMIMSVRIHLIKEAHPVLKGLKMADLESLFRQSRNRTYKQWEVMFKKGEKMPQLTILEKGRAIEYDGMAQELMELDMSDVVCTEHTVPGETFGTRDIVTKKDPPAPYTIIAIDVTTVCHISKSCLEALPSFQSSLDKFGV